jgi:hypothetical protein
MAALPDGEYILTERVANPIPSRLHSRRRGWMRAPVWSKDTHFTIVSGVWSCDAHLGYPRGTKLTDKQRRLVFNTIRNFLVPWAPTLPSQFLTYDEGGDVLDFLVTTGRLTLADVREAYALRNIGGALGVALETFHKPAPPSVPTATPAVPATIRVGDVIESAGSKTRWVAMESLGREFLWQSADGCEPFSDPHRTNSETVVGHVAAMLAEGLAALSLVAAPVLGYAYGAGGFAPVYVGDILIADGNRNVRALVLEAAPSDALGPRVRVAQLGGGAGLNGSISLQRGNGWAHEDRTVLGYDCGGTPVRAGDVLRSVKDPLDDRHSLRMLLTGPAPQDGYGPCASFKLLAGPVPGFDHVSLRSGNGWSVVPRTVPEEHMLPRLDDLSVTVLKERAAPTNGQCGPEIRFETSAFTLDDRDPFTLD